MEKEQEQVGNVLWCTVRTCFSQLHLLGADTLVWLCLLYPPSLFSVCFNEQNSFRAECSPASLCRMLLETNKLCLSIVCIHHVSFHLSLCLPHDILILILVHRLVKAALWSQKPHQGTLIFHFEENWILEYQFPLHCRGALKRFVSITEKLGSPWADLLGYWAELMCAIRLKSCSFFLHTMYIATESSIKKIRLESYLRANCGTKGF